jgi:hypothetical protein
MTWHAEASGAIRRLEDGRGSRVIVHAVANQQGKFIGSEDLPVWYELLRRGGRCNRLDIVLSTDGGSVVVARRLALLLRHFARRVTFLVPYRARSAGTLLCLGGDEIVLGPLGELGPLDPHIRSDSSAQGGLPTQISAEEIRTFPLMAAKWFGLRSAAQREKQLDVLTSRLFPTALAGFYRADRYVRSVAQELLRHHLPRAQPRQVERVIEALVSHPEHLHGFTAGELAKLGLRVRLTRSKEETLLWELWCLSRRRLESAPTEAQPFRQSAIVYDSSACYVYLTSQGLRQGEGGPPRAPAPGWVADRA